MLNELRYTLLSDGSSDWALNPVLTWLLRRHGVQCAIQPQWADLRQLPRPPRELAQKVIRSIALYPCEMLFIHRDAERQPHHQRTTEINAALRTAEQSCAIPPAVCVVPIRMQEAWLLFDVVALREAAGNPYGRQTLNIPAIDQLEQLPDPKEVLHKSLREASGLHGRRRRQFPVRERAHRIAMLIEDFTPLYRLTAFKALDREVKRIVNVNHWSSAGNFQDAVQD